MAFFQESSSQKSNQSQRLNNNQNDSNGIGGHPRGLTTLFFTELWERFSYYGMRAILILYMVAPLTDGGLGLSVKSATAIYGSYTMWVYLLALPGGFIADRWLGAKRAVIWGGSIIALGHFAIALVAIHTQTAWFYTGLVCIVLGTGLLKPSISTMVGELYGESDERRDAGFSLFFMGINIGAACAPILCGFLAQHPVFKELLLLWGLNPCHSWHWGFGAAGVGMVIGLGHFLTSQDRFRDVGECKHTPEHQHSPLLQSLTAQEWRQIWVIFILFVFTVIFGIVSEQAGSSMNLFADRLTHTCIGSWEFPSSWLQSAIPVYVIILAPILSRLWVRLGDKQPSSPAKFALSLLFVGLAFAVMVLASFAARNGEVSPLWLLGAFFLQEIGAVLLNPTGLSVVTKLAPVRLVGMMMGVWFLASAVASRIAGHLAGYFDETNTDFLAQYFGTLSAVMLLSSVVLALLVPRIRAMMGGVR